nr:hypothetical protein [Escherichia coli]
MDGTGPDYRVMVDIYWLPRNTDRTFTYTCKHCGKEHYYDCDMNALAEDIQVLEVEPFIDDIEVSVEGVPYQWRIVPLDGWAMEMLEMRRAALPPEDDAEFKEAIVDLRFGNSLISVNFITMLAVLVKSRLSVVMKRSNGWPLILIYEAGGTHPAGS